MMKKALLAVSMILIFILLSAGMKTAVLDGLSERGIPHWLIAFIISMLPIFELRGGIPVAINVFGMHPVTAYMVCVAGNMVPVIPILLLLSWMYRFFSRWKITKKFFDWLFERTRSRSGQIEKYKMIGLTTFVAIPLPVTGAWTGSIAAVLFNIGFVHALLSVFIGVLIAGVIVTLLSIMGIAGAAIAAAVLLSITIISVYRMVK